MFLKEIFFVKMHPQ